MIDGPFRGRFRFLARCLLIALMAAVGMPAVMVGSEPADPVSGLVERYTPILYFHPNEIFRPQMVNVLLQTARLRQRGDILPDATVLASIIPSAFSQQWSDAYYLDVWLGDNGSSDARNYTALRDYYTSNLSPRAGGPPVVTYARVKTDRNNGNITIQYWLFYFYNDWFNKHEGDWEMIQVVLDSTGQPVWAVYSQHQGGTRRAWKDVPVEDNTHPVVHVSLGSHANYFWGDEIFPHGRIVGNTQVEVLDRTGWAGRIKPAVVMLPTDMPAAGPGDVPDRLAWLVFAGHWGEDTRLPQFVGPLGPTFKGDQWDRPYAWAMRQPLDLETWYANRLSVTLNGAVAQLTIESNQRSDLVQLELLSTAAILHRDPWPDEIFTARILAPSARRFDLEAVVPSPEHGQVSRYLFRNVITAGVGHTILALRAGEKPVLFVDGATPHWPNTLESKDVLWDAQDLAWVAQDIPFADLLVGLVVSFLVGVIPAYLYLALLYYADRYEKEPVRVVLTAFFLGAWPAFIIGLVVIVVFRLPIELWGRDAVEAVRAGILAPVVEEVTKGAIVVYIILRYRREIDSVQDGIIYGAAVGLGFAMTANTLSFLGAFLAHGYLELQNRIFIEGFLYGLNHAFYSAILGAGLAYTLFARTRARRKIIPIAAIVFAIAVHWLHDLILRNRVSADPLAIALTWLGAIVVFITIFWSLYRQRQCIERELVNEVPDRVRAILSQPAARARVEAQALRTHGWRGWRHSRQIFDCTSKLAFRKAQLSAHPERAELAAEVEAMRGQVQRLLASAPVQF